MNIEERLKRLAAEKTLGHAYILYGPTPSASFELAQKLAGFLETKKWAVSDAVLSDALIIDGSKERLGIEVARGFSEFLYRQPNASSRRTLIVNQAGDLTPQAQNALLKLAEEPPSHALIILVIQELGVLLPTILSRFQKLYVAVQGAKSEASDLEIRAQELVGKFLLSNPKQRLDLIKQMTKEEKEVEKADKIIDTFVTLLIAELHKKPIENWRALKHVLSRFTAMQQLSVNKKLQLEALSQWIP
jgi:hypothetical protein